MNEVNKATMEVLANMNYIASNGPLVDYLARAYCMPAAVREELSTGVTKDMPQLALMVATFLYFLHNMGIYDVDPANADEDDLLKELFKDHSGTFLANALLLTTAKEHLRVIREQAH